MQGRLTDGRSTAQGKQHSPTYNVMETTTETQRPEGPRPVSACSGGLCVEAPKPRPVIFLDIDGVMVTGRHITALTDSGERHAAYYGVERWEADKGTAPLPYARFDPDAVARLNRIVAETGAAVVISSAWRGRGTHEMARILSEQGVVADVVGCTPRLNTSEMDRRIGGRGWEIGYYLRQHPEIERWAILDDSTDMAFCEAHFFACSADYGLDDMIAGMVTDHLTRDA